ncbi:MAG: hypothetical protein GXO31_05740 [Epsilonproteobacteria bacterium]|nr:hypothetical protein [Campylobacterota bacterium]
MIKVSFTADSKVVKFYNLTALELLEDMEFDIYDLNEKRDIEEFFERAEDFVESGEADELADVVSARGMDPESIQEAVLIHPNGNEIDLDIDDIVLENISLEKYVKEIKEGEIGDIIYVRSEFGSGTWDMVADYDESDEVDPTNLKIAYYNCATDMDTYELLSESFYDPLCDTLAPDFLTFEDMEFELEEFIFEPIQVYGELYVIKEDLNGKGKVIERISSERRLVIGEADEI